MKVDLMTAFEKRTIERNDRMARRFKELRKQYPGFPANRAINIIAGEEQLSPSSVRSILLASGAYTPDPNERRGRRPLISKEGGAA